MSRVAIVRIDNMTGGASRRSIVARMIVRPKKVQRRIEQTRLLQSKVNRIGALGRSESARAQSFVGLTRIFVSVRQPSFQASLTTALEHTQNISRLRDFPTRQRIEER